MMTTNLIVIVM